MSIDTIAFDHTLLSLLLRFGLNLLVQFILIMFIYLKFSKKVELIFAFFLMGMMVFLICSLLITVELQLGMALGLFAIFAILRFRTSSFSPKEMTYVFTIIGISVINSQANIPPPILGAILINTMILLATYLLEAFLEKRVLSSQNVILKKPELLKPAFRKELLAELSLHTGQNIERVKIVKFDIDAGSAELVVYFKEVIT